MTYWVGLILIAALFEYWAWRQSGKTLSQHWWSYTSTRWVVRAIGCVALIILALHLTWRWP